VLRRFPTMSQEKAEQFAMAVRQLTVKARGVVRDLDPPVSAFVRVVLSSLGGISHVTHQPCGSVLCCSH
jgi:hypothetical protein